MRTLSETIESIRQKPERIRRQYMYACVVMVMVFVVGVWMLSIKQGFRNVAEETSGASMDDLLPKTESIPEIPSLSDLSKEGVSQKGISGTASGDDRFFEEELELQRQKQERDRQDSTAGISELAE